MQSIKTYAKIIAALVALAIAGICYKMFFTNTAVNIGGGGGFSFLFLLVGVVLGAVLLYFLRSFLPLGKNTQIVKQDSTVIINKIERVFKVVLAEAYVSEVFDYSHTATVANLFPSTKKALLIVNAKVMMGYDFKKAQLEIDENTQRIKFVRMPQPEVLSIDQDIKYYNMDNGLFNKFDNEDLSALQIEAKRKILEKVEQSDLKQIAQTQAQHLLGELQHMNEWQIEGFGKVPVLAATN
jgi:Protein of unknown function (DUF4230)